MFIILQIAIVVRWTETFFFVHLQYTQTTTIDENKIIITYFKIIEMWLWKVNLAAGALQNNRVRTCARGDGVGPLATSGLNNSF